MTDAALSSPSTAIDADIPFTYTVGKSSLPLIRLGGAEACERFHDAINAFKELSPYGFVLMPWTPAQYQNHALFLTPDASAGVAVAADGMLHSVFVSPKVREQYGFSLQEASPGDVLTAVALNVGAGELNCFDNGFTRQFYERHGFTVTARFPFDPEQSIPGWKYGVYEVEGREPDFLVMERL
ncbi:MAG: hypothetical protein ACRDAX_07220 [Propionibacteriaceae bacterium]